MFFIYFRWVVKNELNAILMEEHSIVSRSGTPGSNSGIARSGTPGSNSGIAPLGGNGPSSRSGTPRSNSGAREARSPLKSASSYNR